MSGKIIELKVDGAEHAVAGDIGVGRRPSFRCSQCGVGITGPHFEDVSSLGAIRLCSPECLSAETDLPLTEVLHELSVLNTEVKHDTK